MVLALFIYYLLFISLSLAGPVIMSIEEKMEADGRSIYVGNVRTTTFFSLFFPAVENHIYTQLGKQELLQFRSI